MQTINYDNIANFKEWLKMTYGMSIDGVFKHSIQDLNRFTILNHFFRETEKVHVYCIRNIDDNWEYKVLEFSKGNKTSSYTGSYRDYVDALKNGLLEILINGLK